MQKFTSKAVVFIATLAMVFTFAVAVHNVKADGLGFGTVTLKQGSSGAYVMNLQTVLNTYNGASLTVDGNFGPMTKAAVVSFQSAHGLTADGVVGPITMAALTSIQGVMPGLPAGCTSTVGYSTTTGMSCASGTVLIPGCMSTAGYSSTTGQSCSGGSVLPPGCVPGALYSTTTGAACTAGPAYGANLPGSISSTAYVAGYGSTQVGVGAVGTKVAGIQVTTGPGSNINLSAVQVSFVNKGTTTGTYLFNKYFSGVGVWLDGVKVGSAVASSFTESNSVFSASIALSGATIPAGTNSHYLYISVDALPVIDSVNLGSSANTWAVTVNSIRYTDGTGATLQDTTSAAATDGTLTSSMSFTSLVDQFYFNTAASASSIKLTVSKDLSDQLDHTATANASGSTSNVHLATIDLQAQGSAITVKRLPVTVSVVTATSVQDAVSSISLCADALGTSCYDTENITASTTPTSTSTVVTFQSLNLVVPAAGTLVLHVVANINALPTSSFVAGSSVAVSVTSANILAAQAFDANTNQITGSTYLTGSTTGSKVAFYVNGIQVSPTSVAPSITFTPPVNPAVHGIVSYNIPFAVTAFGAAAYIPSTATAATTASATNTIQFCTDATSACQAIGTGIITYQGTDGQVVSTNGNYQVPAGQTRNFLLSVSYTPTEGHFFKGTLKNVNWSLSDVTASGTWNTFTSGLSSTSFSTSPIWGY